MVLSSRHTHRVASVSLILVAIGAAVIAAACGENDTSTFDAGGGAEDDGGGGATVTGGGFDDDGDGGFTDQGRARERVLEVGVTDEVAGMIDTASGASSDGGDAGISLNDPSLASAAFLYPYDRTVFPLGLPSPLMMWAGPAAGDTYRIRLEQANYVVDYYAVAPVAKAEVRVPQALWDRITARNVGSADPLKMTLSRYDATSRAAYTSVQRTFVVATESARGAIYYWTAARTPNDGGGFDDYGAITRIRTGTGSTPETLNSGKCMGCHAVSADGTTMTATVHDPAYPTVAPYTNWSGKRAWAAFDLPSGTEYRKTQWSGANTALSPNGDYVVWGGQGDDIGAGARPAGSKYISLSRTRGAGAPAVITNSGLDSVDVASLGGGANSLMMPAFAPDGSKVAFVVGGTGTDPDDNVIPKNPVAVIYLSFDASLGSFNPLIHSVVQGSLPAAGGRNGLGYPTFSPDGARIAYHRGQYSTGCENGCDDNTVDQGEIWMSSTDGANHVRLDKLNGPEQGLGTGHYLNREPTFNPASRGGYDWIVFTSMREWGHHNATATAPTNGQRRLWIAAVDKTTGAVDPSHPAFYVESQTDKPNMRGFWALSACTETPSTGESSGTCSAGFECCSGFCVDGKCANPGSVK